MVKKKSVQPIQIEVRGDKLTIWVLGQYSFFDIKKSKAKRIIKELQPYLSRAALKHLGA